MRQEALKLKQWEDIEPSKAEMESYYGHKRAKK